MAGIIIAPRARIFHGHEWIYATEIKKSFGNPQPGDVITLKDFRDRPLGTAIYNPLSQIVARRFSRRKQDLDLDFFIRRIGQSIEHRKHSGIDQTLARLVWSESDGLPGLIVDRYGDHLSVQTLTLAMDLRKEIIRDALISLLNPTSDPKQRGLLWHRTYDATMKSDYTFTNPTKIPQTFYISFPLPKNTAGLQEFQFRLGENDNSAQSVPGASGVVTRAILLPASGSVTLQTGYRTRGTDTWTYVFPDSRRIAGFNLTMRTDFLDIDFPVGTGSPTQRTADAEGYTLVWDYPDVLAAPSIGMDMPKRLNAGPVAARIAFFAPVSLLFFVGLVNV